MATNVLELQRLSQPTDPQRLAAYVTVRHRAAILPAATTLAQAVDAAGLRLMLWPDLATFAPMVDAQGEPLNSTVFGWDPRELAPWECREAVLRSPLLRACRVESEPFTVDRDGIHARWANPALDPIGRSDLGGLPLPGAAVVIPVHMPFGQVGAGLLTAQDPGDQDMADAIEAHAESLAVAIRRFVRGYVTATRDPRYLPADSLLSPREIECLSWVAHGKTDYEISIILGCSHAGVRYHLTRVCEKLGAVNRAQSVFRAGQLGLLGFQI